MIDETCDIIVQGITGREGGFHTKQMLDYGTHIVAGVSPGKGGAKVEGVPVYNSVREAVAEHPRTGGSVVFVPPAFAFDAVLESIDAGVEWSIAITEGMPVRDSMWLMSYAKSKGCNILGPNCPGLIIPGRAKMGIMPGMAFSPGEVGVVSRSGTLTYEVAYALKASGLGTSRAIGIGGDPVVGTSALDVVAYLESDPTTKSIVVLGEIGGTMEEEVASAIASGRIRKPVVAYIAGVTAPQGKRMGHAGAILSGGRGSAKDKLESMLSAGALVADTPDEIPRLITRVLRK